MKLNPFWILSAGRNISSITGLFEKKYQVQIYQPLYLVVWEFIISVFIFRSVFHIHKIYPCNFNLLDFMDTGKYFVVETRNFLVRRSLYNYCMKVRIGPINQNSTPKMAEPEWLYYSIISRLGMHSGRRDWCAWHVKIDRGNPLSSTSCAQSNNGPANHMIV